MSEAAAPLSYANRASNLAKEQVMPLQRAPAPKRAAAAPATTAALTSPTAAAAASPSSTTSPALTSPSKSKAAPPPAAKAAQPSSSSPSPSTSVSASPSPSTSSPLPPSVRVVKAPKQGFALVKAVTSGDTLIVMGNITQAGQQLPEKTIIISGVTAPKFAKGKNQVDEPFAWESREYLRKKVIGQQRSAPHVLSSSCLPAHPCRSSLSIHRLIATPLLCAQFVPRLTHSI